MSLELKARSRRPWLKWSLLTAALVALLAGVGVRSLSAKPVPHYETAKVDRGPIVARVTATGVVSALVTVQVGSQVSGRLLAINVDFNSPVKKGDVIAKIDPALFTAAREQAHASFMQAQANLQKVKVQARDSNLQRGRFEALRKQNLIAQADFDTAASNAEAAAAAVDAARADLEQTRASLHQAQVNLDYTTIISPINGVVISRAVDPGQTVAASFQAPTLFTIAEDLRRMQVDTSVAEADVGKLQAGMVATFMVDAFPNERFTGKIRQIRNAPQTVQNVVTYDAVIDVENPELKLRPGMTANVTFVYAEQKDSLRVPNAALRFRPTADMLERSADNAAPHRSGKHGVTADTANAPGVGGAAAPVPTRAVFVLQDGHPRRVPVTVGISDGTVMEIVDGGELHEGDLLVTGGGTDASSANGAASASQRPSPAMRRMF